MLRITVFLEKLSGPKPVVVLIFLESDKVRHFTWKHRYVNFERVHPIVFILMSWIYLLPSTQQTIGYNGFTTTCFDSHESSSGYVQNLLVLALLLLTVLDVVGRYEVVAVLTLIWTKFWKHISRIVTRNRLIFQYRFLNVFIRIICTEILNGS
jgi:hypothetical protein